MEYTMGDATEPDIALGVRLVLDSLSATQRDELHVHTVIVHAVDGSGNWGRGGLFSAILRKYARLKAVEWFAHVWTPQISFSPHSVRIS